MGINYSSFFHTSAFSAVTVQCICFCYSIGMYDDYKKSYGEVLYRWGLLQQRAQVTGILVDFIIQMYVHLSFQSDSRIVYFCRF